MHQGKILQTDVEYQEAMHVLIYLILLVMSPCMLKADGAREMARMVTEPAQALEFRSHVPSLKLGMVAHNPCEALCKLRAVGFVAEAG